MAATTTAAAYAIATTIESLQQTKITMGYHSSAAIFLKKILQIFNTKQHEYSY